uniref:Testis expressed 14, intercellular bridge forming factor n=1 Tax=Chelonoidis abingdonii TaxID=106734 RepID=A0A8C0H2Q4_CHEAB
PPRTLPLPVPDCPDPYHTPTTRPDPLDSMPIPAFDPTDPGILMHPTPPHSLLSQPLSTLLPLTGICVDTINSLGQTALFTAALLGLGKLVDVLLDYGSDPNHRCYDGSTPVHAAAFSGNQWILSKLLDAGGDLRVHDKNGRNPQCWALSAGKESSAQMLEFIQRCASHMQAAIQNFPSDLLRKVGSSKVLVCNPSRFGGITQGNADSPLTRLLKGGRQWAPNCFYLTGSRQLGYLASLPIIWDKEVVQADDEATFSFHTGPYMIMTNLMWGSSRVTVKELSLKPHQNCSKLRLADLLLAEQEYSSKLRHPHLLQLMAVCLSNDLEKTRLVYERVNFGSLYSILHERRSEFPVLHMETIVHLLLQVNDALRFLHSRGFIHRSLTSYAVQIVSAGEAKLTNLEYMIESKDGGDHSDLTRVPVPAQLYKWCAPEVILEKAATVKSDIYSFCIVMQEALTETLPWNGLEGSGIKEFVVSGQHLEMDVRLPNPYYDIVKTGLAPKQNDRSMSLQDIRYILKNDLKSRIGRSDESSTAQRHEIFSDINICLGSTSNYKRETLELCSVSPAEKESIIDREGITCIQPVIQDLSQDIASELQRTYSVSEVDDSLCSFEINEIYACYPELHEDVLEELAGLDRALEDQIKQQNVDEDRAISQILPPLPKIQLVEQPNSSEEGSSSEMGTEYSIEEVERLSEASESCMLRCLGADVRESVCSPSKTEQHISKCVLNLKISQTLLRQATDSLYRTEEKLDKLESVQNQHKLLKEIQAEQVSKQKSIESYLNKIDDILKNIKIPLSGADAFLWKAVGPPSRNYIPPPLRVPGAQSALEVDHFQAISKAVKEPRAIQSEKIECVDQRRKNKDDCQNDFSSNMEHSSELTCSPNSSPDISDEFFTPDPDYLFFPAPQENSEREVKAESTQESLTDIQDLSSISCERENSCKDITYKTPRVSHAPTSVSTPLSPGNCGAERIRELLNPLGLGIFFFPADSSPDFSQVSDHFINELPPPAQELLDEIGNFYPGSFSYG